MGETHCIGGVLAMSTCWNSHRHTKGEEMLREIADLGFRNIELGHGVRLSLMEGVQRYFDHGNVRITSLHNFCPLPVEVSGASPNCYEFTSHRKSDRERAVKLTRRTIDFAARLGAAYVVLHLGHVPMRDATTELVRMAERGEYLGRKYVRRKLHAVRTRERLAPLYLDRTRACLEEIAEYAQSRNVHLGIESRESYEEIPSERELPALIEEVGSPFVGYWHDFGHIQIKENLSLADHAQWLQGIRPHLYGCHLHDVQWPARDHCPPFQGEIDYDRLLRLVPDNALMVWEMSPGRQAGEIASARAQWIERFGE